MKIQRLLTALVVTAGLFFTQVHPSFASTPAPIEEVTVIPSETDIRSTIPSRRASEHLEVVVQLNDPPLAAVAGKRSERLGIAAAQRAYAAQLAARQDSFMQSAGQLGATELARVSKALNAVIVSIPANRLAELTKLPGVKVGAAGAPL